MVKTKTKKGSANPAKKNSTVGGLSSIKQTLSALKREVVGRKVKKLRREGILPANIYGKDVKSLAVQVPLDDFLKTFREVAKTGLLGLKVNGEVRPVLIHNVQLDPITDTPIHADFLQVNLSEKVSATVPVELVGETQAQKSGVGILVQQISELEVEALPADLPEKFLVDVSNLANVDEAIKVSDLLVDKTKVEIKASPDQIVAKIEPPAKEEVAPPPPEAVPAESAPVAPGEEAPAPEGTPKAEGIPAKEEKSAEGEKQKGEQ